MDVQMGGVGGLKQKRKQTSRGGIDIVWKNTNHTLFIIKSILLPFEETAHQLDLTVKVSIKRCPLQTIDTPYINYLGKSLKLII